MLTEKWRSNLSLCSLTKKKNDGVRRGVEGAPAFWCVHVRWRSVMDEIESIASNSNHPNMSITRAMTVCS